MRRELPKQYDPKLVEDSIYQMWMENDCFHADPDPDKKPDMLEGIIAIKEERVFAGSVFYARHASAVCAHIRVVGDYSDACVLCSRLCCDLSDIIWARIVYDNRFYIGEGLIPY